MISFHISQKTELIIDFPIESCAAPSGNDIPANGAKVEEGLSVFKSDKFDADSFVQSRCSLNEKDLRSQLEELIPEQQYTLMLKQLKRHEQMFHPDSRRMIGIVSWICGARKIIWTCV